MDSRIVKYKEMFRYIFFFQAEDGIRDIGVTGVQTCALPIWITPEFIIHLRPDPTFEPTSTGGYDHLALVVEGTNPDALAEYLTDAGVEIESRSENVVGAQGSGEALYVRDPDGYLIELKLYANDPGTSRDE